MAEMGWVLFVHETGYRSWDALNALSDSTLCSSPDSHQAQQAQLLLSQVP